MLDLLDRLLAPERVVADELLDDEDAPADDVERSLRDLRRFNFLLGGRRAWRRLVRAAGGLGNCGSILEIGSGTSDLLESVPGHHRRIALDLKIDHLVYGRQIGDPTILRVVGDATHLPFRDDSIDLSGSSHFFHHFSLEDNELIFGEALRISRRAVFVTDTRRNHVPLVFVKLLGVLRLVGRITRFDAPASVLQGYTIDEVRQFAARSRLRKSLVFRLMPFRFGLVVRKESAGNG